MEVILPALAALAPAPVNSLAVQRMANIGGTYPLSRWEEKFSHSGGGGVWSYEEVTSRSWWELVPAPLPAQVAAAVGDVPLELFTRAHVRVFVDGSAHILRWSTTPQTVANKNMGGFRHPSTVWQVEVAEFATTLAGCLGAFMASAGGRSVAQVVEGAEFCLSATGSARFFGEDRTATALCLLPPGTALEWRGTMRTDALRYGAVAIGEGIAAFVAEVPATPAQVTFAAPPERTAPSKESLGALLGAFGRR